VGYCGGVRPLPTYRKVCCDADYADYAEAIAIDYDPSILTYADVLDAFFRSHDATASGRSRQYASIIFARDDDQLAVAEQVIALHPRAVTTIEPDAPFWEAESYHQKWLLQRTERCPRTRARMRAAHSSSPPPTRIDRVPHESGKRPLMLALGLAAPDELLGPAPTILNAVAGGRLRPRVAMARLEALLDTGEHCPRAHSEICTILESW